MKILVAGSRTFFDYNLMEKILLGFPKPSLIIEGGARGADSLAKQYAINHQINVKEVPADWNRFSKSAGYKRNVKMAKLLDKDEDMAVVFWDGKSIGSKHMIDILNEYNIECFVIRF